jgi:hypothetical protein
VVARFALVSSHAPLREELPTVRGRRPLRFNLGRRLKAGENDVVWSKHAALAVMDQKGAATIDGGEPLAIGDVAEGTCDAARGEHGEHLLRRGHKAVDQGQLQGTIEGSRACDGHDIVLRARRRAADFDFQRRGGLLGVDAVDRGRANRESRRERAALVRQLATEGTHVEHSRGPIKLAVGLYASTADLIGGERAAVQLE